VPYDVNLPSLERLLNFDDNAFAVNQAASDGVSDYLKAFLYRLDQDRPNHLGGERTHFYRHAADGITKEVREDGADIIINETGFRQRLLGGTIEAKNVKNLTIPAIAEAYGHRATEFDLQFIMFKSGAKALVGKSGEDRRVWYWLVESVTQEADPDVLPSTDAMAAAAINSVKAWFNNVTLAQQTGSIYRGGNFK